MDAAQHREQSVEIIRHLVQKNGKWILFDQLSILADACERIGDKDAESLLRLVGYLVGTNRETMLTNLQVFEQVATQVVQDADVLSKMDRKDDDNGETPSAT